MLLPRGRCAANVVAQPILSGTGRAAANGVVQRTHPVLLHRHRATVLYGANVQRAHPPWRGDHTLVRGLSGSQRVRAADPSGPPCTATRPYDSQPVIACGSCSGTRPRSGLNARPRSDSQRVRAADPSGPPSTTTRPCDIQPVMRGGHTWNDAVKRPHHEAAQRLHPTLLHSSLLLSQVPAIMSVWLVYSIWLRLLFTNVQS